MYAIDAKAGDTISVGVELGMSQDDRKDMGRGMPGEDMSSEGDIPEGGMGGPGSGMGGPSGSMGKPDRGMGGGKGMPPDGGKRQMPKKQEIWLKIILEKPDK
jgi:hypothetical protein